MHFKDPTKNLSTCLENAKRKKSTTLSVSIYAQLRHPLPETEPYLLHVILDVHEKKDPSGRFIFIQQYVLCQLWVVGTLQPPILVKLSNGTHGTMADADVTNRTTNLVHIPSQTTPCVGTYTYTWNVL